MVRHLHWRGGRVVDGSGLENQRSESFRGFESRPLRVSLLSSAALGFQRIETTGIGPYTADLFF